MYLLIYAGAKYEKFLLIIAIFFIVTSEAAETMSNQSQHDIGSTQEKQRLLKAIEDCRIHGLEGKHNSRICLLKMMFLRPDLMGRLPKGANVMMLHGPTGTGKTRTAYGIAAEAKEEIQEEIPVIRIDCGIVEGTHVNEGSKYLEPIFADIEEKLQDGLKVILLVDEVDNVAGKDKNNPERNQTATTFWSFCEKHEDNPSLLIITTTNRLDSIYPQVKRRIGDNIISMPGPDFNGRMAILKFHAAKLNIALTDNEIKTFAQKTDGLGGGSLEKLIVSLYFAKVQEKQLSNADIDEIINTLKEAEKDNSEKKDENQKPGVIQKTKELAMQGVAAVATKIVVEKAYGAAVPYATTIAQKIANGTYVAWPYVKNYCWNASGFVWHGIKLATGLEK